MLRLLPQVIRSIWFFQLRRSISDWTFPIASLSSTTRPQVQMSGKFCELLYSALLKFVNLLETLEESFINYAQLFLEWRQMGTRMSMQVEEHFVSPVFNLFWKSWKLFAANRRSFTLACANCRPPTYTESSTLLASIVANSVTGRERSIILSESTVVANTSGFVGANASDASFLSPPLIASLQTMNAFLLNNKVWGAMLVLMAWIVHCGLQVSVFPRVFAERKPSIKFSYLICPTLPNEHHIYVVALCCAFANPLRFSCSTGIMLPCQY